MKQLDDDFKKIAEQYNMLIRKMGFEDNCKVKRFFAIRNRYLISEYEKLSKKYFDLLTKEQSAKSSNTSDSEKLLALQNKYYDNNIKIKLAKLNTPILELLLISIIPCLCFIIVYALALDRQSIITRISWSLLATIIAQFISYIYVTETTWSLKWLNVICSILSASASIITFISPKYSRTYIISAIVIFYTLIQAFINWENANLDWKNKVIREVKQIE